jgi:hypothetical protein
MDWIELKVCPAPTKQWVQVRGDFPIFFCAAWETFRSLGMSLATASGAVLAICFAAGFTARFKEGKAYPNQGIKLSMKNALLVFLITSLSSGLIGGLIAASFGGPGKLWIAIGFLRLVPASHWTFHSSSANLHPLVFNEGKDANTGASRLTRTVPTLELCAHSVGIRLTGRAVSFGELRPCPGDTIGAYSGGAVGGYFPIDLVKVPRTPVAALPVQHPILDAHGKVIRISLRHGAVRIIVVAGTHGDLPSAIKGPRIRSSLRVLRVQQGRGSKHNRNQRDRFHKPWLTELHGYVRPILRLATAK